MKPQIKIVWLYIFSILFSFSSPVWANTQCESLAKECFAYMGDERVQCFYASSTHSFCAKSSLGKLIYRRWAMSPGYFAEAEDSHSLLGPQLIDQECLRNFDNQWSSDLIRGNISENSVLDLSVRLDTCRKVPAIEILRP